MWIAKGIDHPYRVYKYALKRLPGQPPLPLREDLGGEEEDGGE